MKLMIGGNFMLQNFMLHGIMQSLKPLYCSQMAQGIKTNEIRKSFPKELKTPFTVFVYCTKGGGSLFVKHGNAFLGHWESLVSGKVIGQYTCTGRTIYEPVIKDGKVTYDISDEEVATTCVTREEIEVYGNGKPVYFWHVTDFVVYDEPKDLNVFCSSVCQWLSSGGCKLLGETCSYQPQCFAGDIEPCVKRFVRPPQSWTYAILHPNDRRKSRIV